MRISDWSSDVCSSDLQEEGTGLAELERRRDLPSKVQRGAAGEGRLGFTSREVRQAEGGAAREVERDVVRCDDAVTKPAAQRVAVLVAQEAVMLILAEAIGVESVPDAVMGLPRGEHALGGRHAVAPLDIGTGLQLVGPLSALPLGARSEEHTPELQSLMRIS